MPPSTDPSAAPGYAAPTAGDQQADSTTVTGSATDPASQTAGTAGAAPTAETAVETASAGEVVIFTDAHGKERPALVVNNTTTEHDDGTTTEFVGLAFLNIDVETVAYNEDGAAGTWRRP